MNKSELKSLIKECLKEMVDPIPARDEVINKLESLGFVFDQWSDEDAFMSKKVRYSTSYAEVSKEGLVNGVPFKEFVNSLEPEFKNKQWTDADQERYEDEGDRRAEEPYHSEEELEEMSGGGAAGGGATTTASISGGMGPPRVPAAFSASPAEFKKKSKKTAEQLGYKLVKEDVNVITEARYHNFKRDESIKRNESKISYLMYEIKKMLREVNFLTNLGSKLKEETKAKPGGYWKRSKKDIIEIYSAIKEINSKMANLMK
jgi:hypothetical protein